jgi:type VI protein secretion system component Hcp
MATTNVFLIMSEPMFKERGALPTDGSHDTKPASAFGTNAANRMGAIEVLSFGFKIEQVGSEPSGRPRSIESVARSRFTFEKAVDSRSPKLFKYCCEGELIWQAECQIFGPNPGIPHTVFHMGHVHVSSYEPSGGTALATEKIELTFGEMAVKFNNAGIGDAIHGNSRTGSVMTKWSWILDVQGLDLVGKALGGLSGSGSAL